MRRVESPLHGVVTLDLDVLVVPAEAYSEFDEGTNGIIESDIDPENAFAISTAARGSEVYFRSPWDDALDDATPETEAETHIWWLGQLID